MAKRTNKFGLTYFEYGDYTSAEFEMQRWETVDAQLSALFAILGNGVINGWNLLRRRSGGLSCVISPGSGHVSFVAVESEESSVINNLESNRINYIYAQLTNDSYWTKNVDFASFVNPLPLDTPNNLYIGYVETDDNEVISINLDNRQQLGFTELVYDLISNHRHNGALGNPDPIDLSREVQGIIGQENLPDLDASKVKTGILNPDVLPKIDHIENLKNQGLLTHAQLDSYVEKLSINNNSLMGEISTTNLLELILSLKHLYSDIDEYLVNTIAFIPGISPDEHIDEENTTADVDTRTTAEGGTHTITGLASDGFKNYTRTWHSNDQFINAERSDTIVVGDMVVLETDLNETVLDNFDDIDSWDVSTYDASGIDFDWSLDSENKKDGTNSAKLAISSETVDVKVLLKKNFESQDWGEYDYLTFYIFTKSLQHGDLYFYLIDSIYGEQNSATKVLDRNQSTINFNTMENGWQEVTINLRQYQRSNMVEIGFYVSSQDGWDTSKGFDFNIDYFKLSTGNIYKSDGYIRFIHESNIPVELDKIRWEYILPSDSVSDGVDVLARTRVANNQGDLSAAPWSQYVSGGELLVDNNNLLYTMIEIEIKLVAALSLQRTPYIQSVYLDYKSVDVDNSFEFSSDTDWSSGILSNIKIDGDSIKIKNSDNYNNIIYGSNRLISKIDGDFDLKNKFSGSNLIRSTRQILNNEPPSLGLVSGIDIGNNGNIWVSDLSNDRVIEMDKNGIVFRCFQGSFVNGESDNDFKILQCIYNPSEGIIYIVFNQPLNNIYEIENRIDLDSISISVGSHKIYFDDSEVELLGIPKEKLNMWENVDLNSFGVDSIEEYTFDSHILSMKIKGANRTFLDVFSQDVMPSIYMVYPFSQAKTGSDVSILFNVSNFELGESPNGNCIKLTINGDSQLLYEDSIHLEGLSDGIYHVVAELQNEDESINENIEATVETNFVVISGEYNDPYLYIKSPMPNQIYSSSPVKIEFSAFNFPVNTGGQHFKFQLNDHQIIDHYSYEPIVLYDISNGKHTFKLWMVDENGEELPYDYSEVQVDFIVGSNSNGEVTLFVKDGAIKSKEGIDVPLTNVGVDISNVFMSNIFSPIDIQFIPMFNGAEDRVVVAKLQSKSSLKTIGGEENVQEMVARISKEAGDESVILNPKFEGVVNNDLVNETPYLDGYSVVEIDMRGNVLYSNNIAKYSSKKDEAKIKLGSVYKVGESELLLGDSINKRAIIVDVDKNKIVWEYVSDRNVVDFRMGLQDVKSISIEDGSLSNDVIYLKQGEHVRWKNNSAAPVSIYSGYTTFDDFEADPDLNKYGKIFKSEVLDVGENFIFKFNKLGEFYWFVYPGIIVGKIIVTEQRISPSDNYYILESDGLDSPFSSRLIKVDSWGNVIWSFGEGYMVKPRDVRPMLNDNLLVSV